MAKQLENMSQAELNKLFPIIIKEHDQKWNDLYLNEKKTIECAVGQVNIVRINHIGSTYVPGLYAKPTIDILVEIKKRTDDNDIIASLNNVDYRYSHQPDNPAPHMMFMKGYTENGFEGQAYHVHVRYSGDWHELYFRDYLCAHPEAAQEYGELKKSLKEKYKYDREAYTLGKTNFIRYITEQARKELGGKYKPASEED